MDLSRAKTSTQPVNMKILSLSQSLPGRSRLLLAGALVALAGCYTQQHIVWSPDGRSAAVITSDGLCLCDTQGNLSGLLRSNVTTVAWFSDSRRLAIGGSEPCTRWDQLASALPRETQENLRRGAGQLLEKLKKADAAEVLTNEMSRSEVLLKARLLCLRDAYGDDATKALTHLPDQDLVKNLKVEVGTLTVARVVEGRLETGPVLAAQLGPVTDIRLSPDNTHIAYTILEDGPAQLWVVSASGDQPAQMVSGYATLYADWSPDGKSLMYIALANTNSTGDDALKLASLTRQRVVDEQGCLQVQPAKEELVGMLFNDQARVRCLKDGRILFASEEWRLPAATKDLPQRQQLFCLDPERQCTLTALVPLSVQDALPASLTYFEVSPDEKRVAIGDDKSAVAIFALATGEVTVVQPRTDTDLKSIPAWRSSTQLCYIAVQDAGTNRHKVEVALWQPGQTNILSQNWPEPARKGWLD